MFTIDEPRIFLKALFSFKVKVESDSPRPVLEIPVVFYVFACV